MIHRRPDEQGSTTEAEPRRKWPRRTAAIVGLVFLSLVVAAFAWNLTSLRGLPDIGDPFDVAAFSTVDVRDEDNAVVLYRQAAAIYRKWGDGPFPTDWSTASEPERLRIAENREALQIWRTGSERPDGFFVSPGELTFETNFDLLQPVRDLTRLACLEGARLEAEGDWAGAWGWYRAALRASRHSGRRGVLIERLVGSAMHAHAAQRITAWASRPDVDADALRRALDEVQAIDAMTPPMSAVVKNEYIGFIRTMERPEMLWKFVESEGSPEVSRWKAARTVARRAAGFLKREPERSRRVLRLVVANWLAYCDRPPGLRPPLSSPHKLTYLADPSAPPGARLLDPESLRSWYESTEVLRRLMPALDAARTAIDRERARQSSLVIHLASELYRRERGQPPASPEDLVGTYLRELPTTIVPK